MPLTTTDPLALAVSWIAHLEQEEAMLAATLVGLRRVRAALLGRDLDRLNAALAEQEHTAKAAGELFATRHLLRQRLAETVGGRADGVKLQHLVDALRDPHRVGTESPQVRDRAGQLADQLARRRSRLKQMAQEVERLNSANAALVGHSLGFLSEVFAVLTGVAGRGYYNAAGRRQSAPCGTLLEVQG